MAKPCRYQLPGTDTWMSESEFKKALNDGLIDQHIKDGVISIPRFKVREVTEAVTQPVTETPAEPIAEVKEVQQPKEELVEPEKSGILNSNKYITLTGNKQVIGGFDVNLLNYS